MSDEVEAYVTKYALTQGILKVRGRFAKIQGGYGFKFIREGDFASVVARRHEWHSTEVEAKRRAQQLRDNEIRLLKRRLRDLRELQF